MASAVTGALLTWAALAQPAAAASANYDDCAVRVLAGHTYIFVSLDSPSATGDKLLWNTCSRMVQTGYAMSISTNADVLSRQRAGL